MTRGARERLFVALDTPEPQRALELVTRLAPEVGGFKVGLELFTVGGPALLTEIAMRGPVFADLKLHDIPNTVAAAAAALTRLGARLLTVHAGGGSRMLRAAADAAERAAREAGREPPVVLAVTVLTSLDEAELAEIGIAGPCAAAVERFCALARSSGAGGIVCSPHEAALVRRAFPAATIVTPGVRPAGGSCDDQRRTASPRQAIAAGADVLVVGRPITREPDPVASARGLVAEIAAAV